MSGSELKWAVLFYFFSQQSKRFGKLLGNGAYIITGETNLETFVGFVFSELISDPDIRQIEKVIGIGRHGGCADMTALVVNFSFAHKTERDEIIWSFSGDRQALTGAVLHQNGAQLRRLPFFYSQLYRSCRK